MKMDKIFVVIISLFFVFYTGCIVRAVSIGPIKQTAILDPGTADVFELRVLNNEQYTKHFIPEIDSFKIDSKTGSAVFGGDSKVETWVKMMPQEMILSPGESGIFRFFVNIPKDAEPGGNFLGLFASQRASAGQVGVGSRAGSLLFLYVAGEVEESAEKDLFYIEQNFFSRGVNTLHLGIKNSGTVHLDPTGEVVLLDMWGNEVDRRPLNSDHHVVLPSGRWEKSFDYSDDLLGNKFGLFKVKVNLNYGYSEQSMYLNTGFWYIPVLFLVIFSVLVFLLGMVIWLVIRKKRVRL